MTERRSGAGGLKERPVTSFALDQTISYRYDSPVTNLRQQLKVVPPLQHGAQQRRRWRIRLEGADPSSLTTSSDRFGNLTVDVEVPSVESAVDFVVEVEVGAHVTAEPHYVDHDRTYTRPTPLTACHPLVAEVAAGVDPSDIGRLCSNVYGAMTYEWGVTGVSTSAAEALAGGRGVCQDYAHVMLAACRHLGLAARYVSGHLVGEGGSHAWVEVLHPDPDQPGRAVAEGWDPTHDRRTDSQYLVVAVGRDYRDAAPMTGTYVGPGATGALTVKKALRVS